MSSKKWKTKATSYPPDQMQEVDCEHVCPGPHGSVYSDQFKLRCHETCPGCRQPIKYGELNDHLRTCHSDTRVRLKIVD